MKNAKCKMNSGFSLVELIFAVMMLTVIVFGVLKLQTSNLALSNTQNNELQAHFLANQGAEIVKAIGYGDFCDPDATCYKKLDISGDPYTINLATDETDMETIDTIFSRNLYMDKDGLTNAYKATVIVKWTDSTGEHTAEAKRIIY